MRCLGDKKIRKKVCGIHRKHLLFFSWFFGGKYRGGFTLLWYGWGFSRSNGGLPRVRFIIKQEAGKWGAMGSNCVWEWGCGLRGGGGGGSREVSWSDGWGIWGLNFREGTHLSVGDVGSLCVNDLYVTWKACLWCMHMPNWEAANAWRGLAFDGSPSLYNLPAHICLTLV